MQHDDDTVATDPQSIEDAMIAMLEAGQIDGLEAMKAEDTPDEVSLLVLRIPRDVVEHPNGGPGLARMLLNMPAHVHGRVILSFDGWANDQRELHEVPVVSSFLRAAFASSSQCLAVLVDERTMGLDPIDALQVPGQLWAVSHAWPGCYTRGGPTGWMRNIVRNESLLNFILKGSR